MDVAGPGAAPGTARWRVPRKSYDVFISYAHDADSAFAPVLQRGLQHLAKPWNRRRAIEVFRDETSLPVSSGLWSSIQDALDASRWFVLLASPEAARSSWVGKEITHWVISKGTDRLLVVVTAGTWIWDNNTGDFSPGSTVAHPALRGVLRAEPKYLDMTWARRNPDLTLHNPRFRDQVATLAAAIREVPKDEIEGEDVRQQRRTRRIVRAVIATLTVLVLLASVLAVVANLQREKAQHQQRIAVAELLTTQAASLKDSDPALSLQLDIAAMAVDGDDDARVGMINTVASTRVSATLTGHTGAVMGVAFAPDDHTLATASKDYTVRLWDLTDSAHPRYVAALPPDPGVVYNVAFSPGGRTMATASAKGARLWDLTDLTHPRQLATVTNSAVQAVAFARDGHTLATADLDGTARLWDLTDLNRPRRLATITGSTSGQEVSGVAFAPDGHTLATAGFDGTARLWDLTDLNRPRHLATITGGTLGLKAVAFTPDSRTLATAGFDGTARLWDLTDLNRPRRLATITGGTGAVNGVAFAPDGRALATVGDDQTAELWDISVLAHPRPIETLRGHTGAVNGVAFAPDGRTLATVGDDQTARLWQTTNPLLVATLTGQAEGANGVAFAPDGHTLATANYDGTTGLWSFSSPAHPRRLRRHRQP